MKLNKEELNPRETPNPHLQVLYENILHRGISENPLQENIIVRPEVEEMAYLERRTYPQVRNLED